MGTGSTFKFQLLYSDHGDISLIYITHTVAWPTYVNPGNTQLYCRLPKKTNNPSQPWMSVIIFKFMCLVELLGTECSLTSSFRVQYLPASSSQGSQEALPMGICSSFPPPASPQGQDFHSFFPTLNAATLLLAQAFNPL